MKYHLIGDMGISMQGLKKILLSMGNSVTGSDLKSGGHEQSNITPDIDFVVRTSAVSPGSPGWIEVQRANELDIPVLKRSELIKDITKDKFLIAVSGMHGKTTVTSLIALMMIEGGLDPTVLVGEHLKEFDGETVRLGKSKYFVLEACEYDKSFLDFYPDICVVTNLDTEHLDTYPGGMKDIKEAFSEFLKNIKSNGKIFCFDDDTNLSDVVKGVRRDIEIISYNIDSVDEDYCEKTKLIGRHNRLNISAAVLVSKELGVDDAAIKKVLSEFSGASRRLEFWGEVNGTKVYDDYGHHPTEISATISALKDEFPNKKLITVFWPHQYKRILPLRRQFVDALSKSDEIILKPIFYVPGRDEILDISSEDLMNDLISLGKTAIVIENDEEIVEHLRAKAGRDNVVLTIGIPPIYKVAEMLVGSRNGSK